MSNMNMLNSPVVVHFSDIDLKIIVLSEKEDGTLYTRIYESPTMLGTTTFDIMTEEGLRVTHNLEPGQLISDITPRFWNSIRQRRLTTEQSVPALERAICTLVSSISMNGETIITKENITLLNMKRNWNAAQLFSSLKALDYAKCTTDVGMTTLNEIELALKLYYKISF